MRDWTSGGTCPRNAECSFYRSVSASALLRIRYATMYPYCKGGKHEACMRWWAMDHGQAVADDLLPDGGKDNFMREVRHIPTGPQRAKVLVVDDMVLFRKSLMTLVSKACDGACDVMEADSAEQALSLLEQDPIGWSMVVTDYNMGAMSGYDLITTMRLNPSLSGVPAIVFSSETKDDIRLRCAALPRVRWLVKRPDQQPFDDAWRELVLEHKA